MVFGSQPAAVAHRDVAIRQDPDHPVPLADRQRANIQLTHLFRGLFKRIIGGDNLGIVGHDFFDEHDITPPDVVW